MRGLDSTTLVEALSRRLRGAPETVLGYLVDPEGTSHPQTIGSVGPRVYGYARAMPRRALAEVVAVCLPHGAELHAGFWGAAWAGHIPTMIAPPSPRMERDKYARSFAAMLEHVRPRWLIVDAETRSRLGTQLVVGTSTTILDPGEVASSKSAEPFAARPSDIALLQHSSGTTGLQKGVALTHAAVLGHARTYANRLALSDQDIIASWLPLYHDMGLVACFVTPMIAQIPVVSLSPFDWVARPALLLRKIGEHRATLCWQPNFAYGHLVSSLPQEHSEEFDLSSVRAWVNCSEPVSASAHRRFLARFGRDGVRADALTVSYAMAENVFAVTQSQPGRNAVVRASRSVFDREHRYVAASDDEEALELVSNGPCLESTELRVRAPSGELAPPGTVGELELRGAHLFQEYFRRPDLTAPCTTPDGFYRTGDLGFVFEGSVYVTGRVKDLIIIQGRNFYPSDIEQAVSEIEGVVPGRVVAFGINDRRFETEALVIIAESAVQDAGKRGRLALAIRKHVAQHFDCTPDDVRVCDERWLVKSTSGKLARADNRTKYLSELRKDT